MQVKGIKLRLLIEYVEGGEELPMIRFGRGEKEKPAGPFHLEANRVHGTVAEA